MDWPEAVVWCVGLIALGFVGYAFFKSMGGGYDK